MQLYLDIDGVLNSPNNARYGSLGYQGFLKLSNEVEAKYEPNKFINHLSHLDGLLCSKFADFLESKDLLDARIVICSTWRKVFSAKELRYLFYLKGHPAIADRIVRNIDGNPKNDEYPGLNGAEADILEDIRINGVKEYVILSDDVSKLDKNLYSEFKKFANF